MADQPYYFLHDTLMHTQTPTTINELKQAFDIRLLSKGDHLLVQGDTESKIVFVVKGLLRYYYITPSGDDMTKHFALEGEFAASYASLIYGRPSAYGIVAEEDCSILVMSKTTYLRSIDQDRKWERVARKYTEWIYNLKEIREAGLLLKSATERYLDFVKAYPNLETRLKQKHVATYLGVHPVSLSRLKKDLENQKSD